MAKYKQVRRQDHINEGLFGFSFYRDEDTCQA